MQGLASRKHCNPSLAGPRYLQDAAIWTGKDARKHLGHGRAKALQLRLHLLANDRGFYQSSLKEILYKVLVI